MDRRRCRGSGGARAAERSPQESVSVGLGQKDASRESGQRAHKRQAPFLLFAPHPPPLVSSGPFDGMDGPSSKEFKMAADEEQANFQVGIIGMGDMGRLYAAKFVDAGWQ